MRKFSVFVLLVFLLAALLAATAYGITNSSKTVTTSGRITTINVGVYKDSACTQAATAIDWGNLTGGTSATFVLYLKNIGNSKETITMSTSSWSPSTASQYITITWDQNNAVLSVNQIIKATLTLTVSADADASITTFSNNIVVTGTM